MMGFSVRPIEETDRASVNHILRVNWGASEIISRGFIHNAGELPGFVAFDNGRIVGLLTYNIRGDQCEIVTLNSFRESIGVGSALIVQTENIAIANGCKRLWLITTNDNLLAIRFYQKRGFRIAAIHIGAIVESRKLKPEIPLLGNDDIPIRDEIEMEMLL
jgi:ribosomal protein S18 acetylase RimI-like enzyme